MDTAHPATARTLPGIGTLVNRGLYWQLTYERCSHTLDIVKWNNIEDCVRTHHAACLECTSVSPQRNYG